MNTRIITAITLIIASLALAGCTSAGAASPIGTQLPQPPSTEAASMPPSPTAWDTWLDELATDYVFVQATAQAQQTIIAQTPTGVPTPTGIPSPHPPVPTATNYPDPAVPLSSTGPWLVFWADYYLWAINQDGTGLTRLNDEEVYAFAVRPGSSIQNGLTIAYYSLGTIKLLSWPGGNVKTIVYNLSAYRSPSEWPSLAWSPGGSKLAFIGAMGDTSLNVFVYDTVTEQSTRITATD